jgi:hypothetical protein
MRRFPSALLLLATVSLVSSCSHKNKQEAAFDQAADSGVTPEPRNPHVLAFELGHGLDSTAMIYGGVDSHFGVRDSIYLSVRAQYAPAGATVAARLLHDDKTVDSTATDLGAPDNTGVAAVGFRFGTTRGWPTGNYQVEVFLNDKSQGLKNFQVAR